MKTHSITLMVTSLLGCAAIGTLGCTQVDRTAEATAKTAQTGTRSTTQVTTPKPDTLPAPQTQPAAVASQITQWSDVKDASFALRAQLFTDLAKLQAKVDDQVKELTGRRASLPPTADTSAWDFAMKEMDSSRTGLQSSIDDLGKATEENWDEGKDKVGIAWTRSQDAYAKVLASTTSGTTASNN